MSFDFSSYGGTENMGSPSFSGTATEVKATRVGTISWSSIDSAYIALFPSAVGGVPQLPTLLTGSTVLRAESFSAAPLLGDNDKYVSAGPPPTYTLALVQVGYSSIPLEQTDPESDQIISRRHAVSGQMMTLPNTGLRWFGESEIIQNPEVLAAKFVGTVSHEVTLHRVPSVPWATIRSLVGKVNNAAFEGAAAETLLFDGVDVEQTVTADGTMPSQVTLKFIERNVDGNSSITWNHLFDPKTGTFRRVKRFGYAGDQDESSGVNSQSEGDGVGGEDLYVKGNFSLLY